MIIELKKTRTSFLAVVPSSTKIIAVSSNAADTQTVSLAGSSTATLTIDGTDYVTTSTAFTSISAIGLSATAAGTISIYTEGEAGGAVLYFNGGAGAFADGDTVELGISSGNKRTYTFKASLTGSANEVKVGASAAASVANLAKVINLTGTAGTDWGTGTVIHKHYTASYTSGTTLSVADKTKIRRTTSPVFSSTNTDVICTPFTTGTSGKLLASMTTGETSVTGLLSLTNPGLALTNLPANTRFVSDWIKVRGTNCALRFRSEDVTTPLDVTYQTSINGTTVYAEGEGTISSLDNDNAPTYFDIPEICEYLRVSVNNTNGADVAVDGLLLLRN